MDDPFWRNIYEKLNEATLGTEKYGTLKTGQEIERLSNMIIKDIADPLVLRVHVIKGKTEFDGEIIVDEQESIFYQIYAGTLSEFRYRILSDMIKETQFPQKAYILVIARSFVTIDRQRIHELVGMINPCAKVCFIDYDTLIALHKYCSENITANRLADADVKIVKRLFLEKLLESSPILRQKTFAIALKSALENYAPKYKEPLSLPSHSDLEEMKNRIKELENKVNRLLNETAIIRADYLDNDTWNRPVLKDWDFIHKIDLRKLESKGEFPCPTCGKMIDPGDETGETYEIIDAVTRRGKLMELLILCRRCATRINLVGFMPHLLSSPRSKMTKKSILAFLEDMK